ncbi:ATP-binding protein [Eleftheria terrae]|uniref:ATP-binding protein n=1 Tax=Eleftheria terrae TaxID=1597781 RepID=UPI00263B7076|nr:ATP-binding protein [Eleftheria terrae]WKB53860.1 ATP-binding protein [Eleftheria terrae]
MTKWIRARVGRPARYKVLILLGVLLVLGAAHYAILVRSQEHIIEHEAVRVAEIVASQALVARSVYSREVVAKLAGDGFGSTPDYKVHPGFAPIPAQFLKYVGRDITRHNSGLYSYRPLSRWNLEASQGLRDDFQRWAWQQLQAQDRPDPPRPIEWKPAWRFETLGGRRTLRYMRADPASEQGCVACHNGMERLPEVLARRVSDGVEQGRVFKLHQLLGAVEVHVPVDRVDALAESQAHLTLLFVLATSFAGVMLVGYWLWRDARSARRSADHTHAALSLRASAMQSALGNAGEAVKLALQALAAARRWRLPRHMAAAHECLGDIRHGQGREDRALVHWQRSMAGFEDGGMPEEARRLCQKLLQACDRLGLPEPAARWRRHAQALAERAQGSAVERRVRQLTAELDMEEERRRNAEAAFHTGKMAALGRMVAGVNHEVKRPLASMRMLAELSDTLLQRGETERVRRNLHDLVQLADQLTELTRSLEDFARKQPYHPLPERLRDCLRQALRVLEPQLHGGTHRVLVHGNDAWALVDAQRVRLILVNLLSNAIEATAGAADRRIHVSLRDKDSRSVLVRVRDHGPGLNAEAQAHLFEIFVTTKAAGQGLGMGLALSAKLAREMGGELSGRNHPDGGAEFTLRLPRAQPDARPEAVPPQPGGQGD